MVAQKNMEEPRREEAEELEAKSPEEMAVEIEEKAEEERKGLFGRLASVFGKRKWERRSDDLGNLEKEAQEAEEKLKTKLESIEGGKESGFKEKLDNARDKFIKAKAAVKKFQGIRGTLRRIANNQAAEQAQKDHDNFQEEYLENKAEYVGDNVEKYLDERTELADAQAEQFTKERGWGKSFYNAYKKLGEWNLTKLGWKPKGRIGKVVARAASMRTAVSLGLLGVGTAVAAAGAAGAAAGVFVGRRVFGGMGAGIGSFDLMKMVADRKLSKEVSDEKLKKMNSDEIRKRLEYFESVGPMNGKKPSEIVFYRKLQTEYGNRLKAELGIMEEVEKKGQEARVEEFENTKTELSDQAMDAIQIRINKIIKISYLLRKKYQVLGGVTPEMMQKEKELREEMKRLYDEVPDSIDDSVEDLLETEGLENILTSKQASEMLNSFSGDQIDEDFEDIIMATDLNIKPEVLAKFERAFEEDQEVGEFISDEAKATMGETAELMEKERRSAAEKGILIQQKLAELSLKDLDEVEARGKKAKKNNKIMKTVAAGVGVFVGSGGISWLTKQFEFAQAESAPPIKDKRELLGIRRAPEMETGRPAATEIESAEEVFEAPEMEIKPAAGLVALKKGEGVLHGINRILENNPDLQSEFKTPKDFRAWKLGELKKIGYEIKGNNWKTPFTVHEGDRVGIGRAPDGSLELKVAPNPEAALTKEDLLAKQAMREGLPPRKLPMTENEKLRALMNKQLEWAFSEEGPKTFDEQMERQLKWAFSEEGPKTFDEQMNRQLKWAFSEQGPKTFNEEMQGQLDRWFVGPESKTVPAPGLDEKIAAAKAAQETPAARSRVAEAEAPARGRAGIETAEPEVPVEEAKAPSAAETAAEATAEGELSFKTDHIRGGKIQIEKIPGGIKAIVKGSVYGIGKSDLIDQGILKEDYRETLYEKFGGRASIREGAVSSAARRIYLYNEAIQSAESQGREDIAKALKKSLTSIKRLNSRSFGKIFG